MVDVVELTFPGNVTLLQGAMQNWRDLPEPGPTSWAPATQLLKSVDLSGDVLVLGAHHLDFLRVVAERAGRLTVVTRAIPDAADIGEAFPEATVFCGSLRAAADVVGPASAVIAAVDAALLQSTEESIRTWAELTDAVCGFAAPGAAVLLAVENERGLHRQNVGADPFIRETDADWSPLATWDVSRPRSAAQLREVFGADCSLNVVLPQWNHPTAVLGQDAPVPQQDLAVALAGADRSVSALTLRSVGLARAVPDQSAGWVVAVGVDPGIGDDVITADGRWSGSVTPDGRSVAAPHGGRTLLTEFVELATGYDLPGMRRVLQDWYQWVQTEPGVDVSLSNVVRVGDGFAGLRPAAGGAGPVAAAQEALSDAMKLINAQGLSHPWPTSMHPVTRYCAVLAMAGVPRPTDDAQLERLGGPEFKDLSRDVLLALVRREQNELKTVWARAKWDEREYLTYRASVGSKKLAADNRRRIKNAPATVKAAPQKLKAVPRKVKKRFLG